MKNKRHETILKLIAEHDVETQEMLCDLLHEAGFPVAQATVSRDIRELALIKVRSVSGTSKYALSTLKKETLSKKGSAELSMLMSSVKNVDHAGNIAVIKCTAGMANAICAKLDAADLYGCVGTIAGDDTIFILMRTEKDAQRLEKEMKIVGDTMLEEIYIENLAVIEKATIGFTEKLNVFTGETGAGKSILINGINALLGQRTSKDIVRTGAKKAVISGCFSRLNQPCLDKLHELGFDTEDGKLFLTREINSDGGSSARINSRSINISALREIGQTLVTIHGQHDNQILMSPERHIEILDSYADAEELLADYRQSFHALQDIARQISHKKKELSGKKARLERLNEVIEELSALEIKPDEDTAIEEELEVSKNAVYLTEAALSAARLIKGDDDDFDGADGFIRQAIKQLESGTEIMSDFADLYERLNSVQIEAADIASELLEIADRLNADPRRFEWLNSRARELERAKEKYGPTLDEVISTYENAVKEAEELNGGEESIAELVDKQKEMLKDTSLKAAKLSQFRKEAADRFVKQVTEELEFLNMPKVKLVVNIQSGRLTVNGMDTVEFLISANVGEEPKPIAKIASGGELSRIMLALKSVIADKDSIDTLIFDEIDTGVSGRAAQKIGMKLKSISRYRQVLCVTHLSQMAVMADNHLLIEKNVVGDRTVTQIKPLDFEERKQEIARIIGGDTVTELTLKNAEELLKEAELIGNE